MLKLGEGVRAALLAGALMAVSAAPAGAQLSPFMSAGLPDSEYAPRYSDAERAAVLAGAFELPSPPRLGAPVTLTPNSPYAEDGSRLHFWKTAFLVGSENGGEAGINFWGLHNEGHINVGFTPRTRATRVLDCRILSAQPITYRIYTGASEQLASEGERALVDGHFLLMVPVSAPDVLISVELWPTPLTQPMGFLGCDIAAME